ncbi:hypothetical protein QVD17_33884 [Tagetes erecta]|uniref:Uncharacterized protein n=1 Tax=Tagetes erecta TaxID=13708 RepID=A0AAD8K1F2_TARER|nr:hypothetical protein QVD17_33884 [Tagetes erecta]
MAKDQPNKSFARSSYEKISKVTFGFTRRTSHDPKNIPNTSLSTTNPPTMNPYVSQTPSSILHPPVPREMASTPKPESFSTHEAKPFKRFVRFSSSTVKKSGDDGGKELTANKTFSEEKYNSYIDDTKMKMRAPSNVSNGMKMRAPANVSSGRTISRRESINDMFAGYISRTKMRLRTISGVNASNTLFPSLVIERKEKKGSL